MGTQFVVRKRLDRRINGFDFYEIRFYFFAIFVGFGSEKSLIKLAAMSIFSMLLFRVEIKSVKDIHYFGKYNTNLPRIRRIFIRYRRPGGSPRHIPDGRADISGNLRRFLGAACAACGILLSFPGAFRL